MDRPLISIVMGYYNRMPQCLCTLDTINQSAFASRLEVIIVDDCSDREHDLSGIPTKYRFPIKLIKIPKALKTWTNPVVAYNLGITKALGEWIILQNPEVCHIGDICKHVAEQANTDQYLAFQVFACHDEAQSQILRNAISDTAWVVKQLEAPQPQSGIKGAWYCHPRYRAKAYHFCTAIHRSKLLQVGGFNPTMKEGIDYDDDELLCRIERVCKVGYVQAPGLYGIHQWHPKFAYQHANFKALQIRNRMIFQKTVTNRQFVSVDIRSDLEALRVLSLPTITIGCGPKPVAALSRLRPLMKEKTVVTITGIRPDFIRMSEVFKQLDVAFRHVMIHTGQHYDTYLSDAFFRDLNIRSPDYHLEAGINSKNHYEQLSYLSTAVIRCIQSNNIRPDLILFLGDSNTSAVALPLKKEGYTIGHIEAGMRSGDRRMLEEINRTVCDVCSDVFFVYHDDNRANLEAENIRPPERPIFVVGNTIVEVCVAQLEKLQLLSRRKYRNMILMDIHRPENFNDAGRLQSIFAFANVLLRHFKVPVKCLHFKRLLDQITALRIDIGEVEIIPLLSYPDYLTLVYHSKCLLSDSGTAQEEPALLSTPVIVPRDFTERPQSYTSGCSIQFRVDDDDESAVSDIIKWVNEYERRDVDIGWLGEGHTAELIVSGIAEFFSRKL